MVCLIHFENLGYGKLISYQKRHPVPSLHT